ncbi:putative 5 alpha steroid reductase [Phytophthora cinnamomi]|uniref:putative 5 alpha steroid reductase n=1 Tax=Phytophthora cinnamomi TaxID=4785 RepID=UPI0035593F6E|nr:putative 5 alpha steroid reductase [Phytophthora cinnamomi]
MGLLRDVAGSAVALSLAALVATQTGLQLYAAVCMGAQWLSALYAVPKQDERFFDLTGSVTYALVSLLAYAGSGRASWRESLLTALVWLWCVRLGAFLFLRIRECGEDKRFKDIRVNPLRFLGVWSIQGLWVLLTALPVLLALEHGIRDPQVSPLDVAGLSLWAAGYALEVAADYQKTQFRRDQSKKGQFIQSGLWYYSRHPNYCGEIMMWIGVFCTSVHTLPSTALKCWAAVSPAFVAFLLLFVSGVPLLEQQAEERWGSTRAYQEYKAQTCVLVPMPKLKAKAA